MDKEVKFKGKIIRKIYSNEDFKVYAVDVDSKLYTDIKKNKYNNVSIVGDIGDLTFGVEYDIVAIEENSKNGISYKVKNITRKKPTTIEDSFTFLSEVITRNQAETLLKAYPNIIQKVIDNDLDDIDFSKTKGIKEKTFEKIKNKIIDNICLAELVTEFKGYLSLSIIRKIYNKYPSVQSLKSKLKSNPYKCLCGLGGVGFKTADSILLEIEKVSNNNIKNGKDPIIVFDKSLIESEERCLACILYLLEENESNGHTKMNLADLRKEVLKTTPECLDKFVHCIKDDSIYYDKKTMDVALAKTYNLEKYIAKQIKYGLSVNRKWDIDYTKYTESGGNKLTDEQESVLKYLCDNNVIILNGSAGCVDCDTEYFNGIEWKRIADYQEGEKVLQYNKDGTAELVYPLNYIRKKADYLWHFETKYGLDQCLCDEHNCYYITSKGNLYHKTFKEVRENQESNGFKGKFITTFNYQGKGIDLSDDEIRLMIAVFADGSFYSKECSDETYKQARFHLKKDRKKQRLEALLTKMNLDYKKVKSSTDGYDDYYIIAPFRSKHFPKEWYQCNKHQLEIIFDEVMYWDGRAKKQNNYSTTNKSDADFIQFVLTSLGYRATISTMNRTGKEYLTGGKMYIRKSIEYVVSYTTRTLVSMCYDKRDNHIKTEINKYKTLDGMKYCFTVPSHILVLRRNNKIFITGNCGKSATTSSIINMLSDNSKTVTIFAPTGRASKISKSYTGLNAKTIHRGLGFMPPNSWTYNLNNKLNYDVIIIDEFSMCGLDLFGRLIDAIDFNKTKLLLVGDAAQLPSVSAGNLMRDFINSKKIPMVTLTKIFRYNSSGIINVATDIRMGKQYLPKTKDNMININGNKDYTFIKSSNENTLKSVVTLYKKLLNNGCKVEDIQVLSSYNKGDYGTVNINNKLQRIANKNYGSENNIKVGETTYYVDDIIIQKSNNYKAIVNNDAFSDDITTFISNGECGKIIDINNDVAVIDFDGTEILYTKSDLINVRLGYSISIHSSQGGAIKIPIIVTPRSHSFMLNSNLLYVGITRATSQVYHIGDVFAVNNACLKREDFNRNTFMEDFLKSS